MLCQKYFILVSLLFLAQITFAQEKQFNFGLNLLPETTHITIGETDEIESSRIGFGQTILASIEVPMSSNFALKTGFGASIKRFNYRKGGLLFGTDVISGTKSSIDAENQLISLEVPLLFKYYLNNSKLFLSLGGSFKYLIAESADGQIKYGNGEIGELQEVSFEVRDENISGILSFGYVFLEKEKFRLTAAPTFQFDFLTNQLYFHNTKSHYYSIGIAFGVDFR